MRERKYKETELMKECAIRRKNRERPIEIKKKESIEIN